jgi:hypothetical protein
LTSKVESIVYISANQGNNQPYPIDTIVKKVVTTFCVSVILRNLQVWSILISDIGC